MTTEPSPGQGAPQDDHGWAFRPRQSAAGTRPYREPQQTGQAAARETGPYGSPAAPRWDTTVPLRFPEPRTGAHEAMPGPDTRREDQQAHQTPRRPPAKKTRWVGRIAHTLTVLAAAGGTAAVLLKQETDATVASHQLTRQWQIPAPAADDALTGSWLTDKLLVRASTKGGLRAYDLTDGKQAWAAKPSTTAAGHGTVPCAMSPTLSSQGIGTVAFGKDGSTCTWLAGIKASTGKILWTIPLTGAKHRTATTATTYVQGHVATVVSENVLGGVDLRTGARVWAYKARGQYCNAYDWGADGTVLVDDYCLDKKSRFTLTAYDGRTGKVVWRKHESAHSDVTHILSGAPLVAAVHTARQDAVRVFDTTGTGKKLAVGDDELTTGNDTDADHSARLYGNVLVTPATAESSMMIIGFDTTTGAKLWTHGSAALAVPAAGADDKVYAVSTSGTPQLVTIDPRTGHTSPVAGLPAGPGKWNFTSGTVYVTPDGGVLELNALGSNGGVRFYR